MAESSNKPGPEEGRHGKTIDLLSEQLGLSKDEANDAYYRELNRLNRSARITSFLPILICKAVKQTRTTKNG